MKRRPKVNRELLLLVEWNGTMFGTRDIPTNWISWFFIIYDSLVNSRYNVWVKIYRSYNFLQAMKPPRCWHCHVCRVAVDSIHKGFAFWDALNQYQTHWTDRGSRNENENFYFIFHVLRQTGAKTMHIATIVSFSKFMPQEEHLLRIYVYSIKAKVLFQR